MKHGMIDIHAYGTALERALRKVQEQQGLSRRNRELILRFDQETRVKEGVGTARRIKVLSTLRLLARNVIQKDFDRLTKHDLEQALARIEDFPNANTRHDYKVILKKFLRWIEWGDRSFRDRRDCPEWLRIIRTNMTRKERAESKLTKGDLLTVEEVYQLIQAASHPRDKALIAVLYELGARIAEIGNLQLKDVTKHEHGFHIDLTGKTGRRTPIAVMSAPHLATWLNTHPFRDEPRAPLWVQFNSRVNNLPNRTTAAEGPPSRFVDEPITYDGLGRMIQRVVQRAGVAKRVYPHLFRHSRVTHLLVEGALSESQAKRYFGWAPSSRILGEVYSHLTDQDANDAILSSLGLQPKTRETDKLRPKVCAQCRRVNPADFRFCGQCAHFLDTAAALAYQERSEELDAELYTSVERMLADPDSRQQFLKHLSKDLIKKLAA